MSGVPLREVTCPDCGSVRVTRQPTGNLMCENQRWYRRCRACSGDLITEQGAWNHKQLPERAQRVLDDRARLEALYTIMSPREVGESIGCSEEAVRYWLTKHGIPTRSRSEATKMMWGKRSQRRRFERNRQMVTGEGWSDRETGSLMHV